MIYIASSLSNAEINYRIALSISNIGVDYYLPQDDPINKTLNLNGKTIAERNKAQIKSCDCLLVIYHKMGIDTSWEAGYVFGLGKPYFLICTEDELSEAKNSIMPFFSSDKIIVLPDWGVSIHFLTKTIKEVLQL